MPDEFLNPYGFVSIPDRDLLPGDLGDHRPAGHDRYREDRWTGNIPITVTTVTPLLIPDHWAAARNDAGSGAASVLPVRVDDAGRPILPGSAVKGMLRSAYEVVTNSRLGVFTGHDLPLAVRATATRDIADRLRPAVVVQRDPDSARIKWVDELVPTGMNKPGPQPNPAVWIPLRLLGDLAAGQMVEAWIRLFRHRAKKFWVWRVCDVAKWGESALPLTPSKGQELGNLRELPAGPVRVCGLLHRTRSLFPADARKNRKHDERLMVTEVLAGPAKLVLREGVIGPDLIRSWQAVIDSFAFAHENEPTQEVKKRYGTYVSAPAGWRDLTVGRTLHVELDGNRNIVGLFPAMIGRKPFAGNPIASLPGKHRPASTLAELSPADRVFGWVRQGAEDGEAAYRGHLRVDPGTPPGKDSVRRLARPLPLATLNSPKPAQFLFYLGDEHGQPLQGKPKHPDQGYPTDADALHTRRLRGRKVYLTQADVVGSKPYWEPAEHSAVPIQVGGADRYRAYQAPPGYKERITTTVSQWVAPGATFHFTLRVDNLSATELGALLWLLDLPAVEDRPAYHKLGLGKPLGFGVVRVAADLTRTRLYTGDTLRGRYRSLAPKPPAEPTPRLTELRKDYNDLMSGNNALTDVRTEFLAAACGYPGHPVHYPRLSGKPVTQSYEWWVANDKPGGARHALPELSPAPVLPYDPTAVNHQDPRDRVAGQQPQPGRGPRRRD